MVEGEIRTVDELLLRIRKAATQDEVTVDEIVTATGRASLTALLLVPSLLVVTPLSGIPLFSSLCGLTIVLIAGQLLLGRQCLWLPSWVNRRRISGRRLRGALDWLRKPAGWIDRYNTESLTFLVRQPFITLPRALCVVCGAAMPLFEIVPFTSSILGGVVTILAVAMLARNGLLVALGTLPLLGGAAWALGRLFA